MYGVIWVVRGYIYKSYITISYYGGDKRMKIRMLRLEPSALNRLMVDGSVNAMVEFADGTQEQIRIVIDNSVNVMEAEYGDLDPDPRQ